MCLPDDDCSVHCYDSRQYACIGSHVDCPSVVGNCAVNCDDAYSCLQANTTCSQGNCTVNCEGDYACQYLDYECSGANCLLDCYGEESCQNSVVDCSSEHCALECDGTGDSNACNSITYECAGEDCSLNCPGHGTCRNSNIKAVSSNSFYWHCWKGCSGSTLTCTSKTCHVNCENYFGCNSITFLYDAAESFTLVCNDFGHGFTCGSLNILPVPGSSPGSLTVGCYGNYVCRGNTEITCPSGDSCVVNCQGPGSCDGLIVTCPAEGDCTIECGSCHSAQITCPVGDHRCNILCVDPNSCGSLSITNTHNLHLQCCGGTACSGVGIAPDSTECR